MSKSNPQHLCALKGIKSLGGKSVVVSRQQPVKRLLLLPLVGNTRPKLIYAALINVILLGENEMPCG